MKKNIIACLTILLWFGFFNAKANDNTNLQNSYFNENSKSTKKDILEFLKIVALGTFAASAYGVIQDNVTVRISKDYFLNPDMHSYHAIWAKKMGLDNNSSNSLIALKFGVGASWWMGSILGTVIATAATLPLGKNIPKLKAKEIIKPLLVLLSSTGIGAFISGIKGYSKYKNSTKQRQLFMANGYAHNTAYLLSTVGSIALTGWIINQRIKLAKSIKS